MVHIELDENERIDVLNNGYKIIQGKKGLRFGTDSILLAGYIRVKKGENIVDLGTGTGIIPLLIAGRIEEITVTAIEILPEIADRASRSVSLNGEEGKISIINADIRNIRNILPSGSADVVSCNPPYYVNKSGKLSPDNDRNIARCDVECSLHDVAIASKWLLRYGGRLIMVLKPQRLCDAVYELREAGLEPKNMKFVYPNPKKEAFLLLLESYKGARPGLKIQETLFVKDENNVETEDFLKYYKNYNQQI